MTLPFRRRKGPRGAARLAPVGDIPGTSEADTEQWLSQIRPGDYDGTTYEWGGANDIGVMAIAITQGASAPLASYRPAPASFPALPARTPQHQGRRPDARPGDGTWDRSPQALRAAAGALREQPAPRPPAIRPLAPELPPREGLPAVQVTAMLGAIRYPGADGTPEDYATVMRRWSHLTGTVSGLESPGAWPRHALEAMPGEAEAVTS